MATRTTPHAAAGFVAATDIDVLAPNLGNLHRMPDDSTQLDLDWIRSIAEACGRPLALHGGSGIDQAQLAEAIDAGIAKINVSSRVTRALAAGIRATWLDDPEELDLRRYLGAGRERVQALAAGYLRLAGVAGRSGRARGSAGPSPAGRWTGAAEEPE
jgi:fructose-bisphosphate aldolase class II